jgi:hypothetical protein
MFILKIQPDNDAFRSADGHLMPEMEIARILRDAADEIENRNLVLSPDMTLHDYNGNACGSVRYR